MNSLSSPWAGTSEPKYESTILETLPPGELKRLIIVNIILELIINILKLLIIDLYSPFHAFIIYLYTDILNYIMLFFTESMAKYITIIILSFICIIAILIFLERIELNFCGLSKMIKKNIDLRAQQEYNSSKEDINDDEKEIDLEDYSIELVNTNQELLNQEQEEREIEDN